MSGRKQNVGRRDRIARALLTPLSIGAMIWFYTSAQGGTASLVAAAAFGLLSLTLLTSALTGTCGIYASLGIDTCNCEPEYAGGDVWG